MTIQEALDMIDMIKPNMVPPEAKVRWLGDLDGMLWREVVLAHEHGEAPARPKPPSVDPFDRKPMHTMQDERQEGHEAEHSLPDYDMVTDLGTQLLAPHPYSKMYPLYLAQQIDLANAEIEKYNNDSALFQTAFNDYNAWYTRTHMPRQRVREFRL